MDFKGFVVKYVFFEFIGFAVFFVPSFVSLYYLWIDFNLLHIVIVVVSLGYAYAIGKELRHKLHEKAYFIEKNYRKELLRNTTTSAWHSYGFFTHLRIVLLMGLGKYYYVNLLSSWTSNLYLKPSYQYQAKRLRNYLSKGKFNSYVLFDYYLQQLLVILLKGNEENVKKYINSILEFSSNYTLHSIYVVHHIIFSDQTANYEDTEKTQLYKTEDQVKQTESMKRNVQKFKMYQDYIASPNDENIERILKIISNFYSVKKLLHLRITYEMAKMLGNLSHTAQLKDLIQQIDSDMWFKNIIE